MDKLKAEWQELSTKKKAAYKEYRVARSTMQEVLTVKANIDALLGDTGRRKTRNRSDSVWTDMEQSDATTLGQFGTK